MSLVEHTLGRHRLDTAFNDTFAPASFRQARRLAMKPENLAPEL